MPGEYFFREVATLNSLLQDIFAILRFVLMCVALLIGLAILARIAEHFLPSKRKVTPARRVSIIGISAAIATVLHMLDFPLLFLAPEFYKLDFSELPVLMCGPVFLTGPLLSEAGRRNSFPPVFPWKFRKDLKFRFVPVPVLPSKRASPYSIRRVRLTATTAVRSVWSL